MHTHKYTHPQDDSGKKFSRAKYYTKYEVYNTGSFGRVEEASGYGCYTTSGREKSLLGLIIKKKEKKK